MMTNPDHTNRRIDAIAVIFMAGIDYPWSLLLCAGYFAFVYFDEIVRIAGDLWAVADFVRRHWHDPQKVDHEPLDYAD